MDLEKLVENITKKVLDSTIQDKAGLIQANPEEPVTNFLGAGKESNVIENFNSQKILVILPFETIDENVPLDEIKLLSSKGIQMDILVPSEFSLEDENLLKQISNVISVTKTLDKNKSLKIYSDNDIVLIPEISVEALSKIANLNSSTTTVMFAIKALRDGKKVYATDSKLNQIKNNNPNIVPAVNNIITQAKGTGLNLLPIQKLSMGFYERAKKNPEIKELKICASGSSECGECDSSGLCINNSPDKVSAIIQAGATRIGAKLGVKNVRAEVARFIDHTHLKPDAKRDDIVKLCNEAKAYKFASVCVNPTWVHLCSDLLKGSGVKVCTVIGFPLGATTTATKIAETREAIANGADEIDMVINVGELKSGNYDFVKKDIEGVVNASGGRTVKVILETGLLSDDEKMQACLLCKEAGASFVKTSTGFGPGGATLSDIALMRKVVGDEMGVKASGGVRDYETTLNMLAVGATRIGASAGVSIVQGKKSTSSY